MKKSIGCNTYSTPTFKIWYAKEQQFKYVGGRKSLIVYISRFWRQDWTNITPNKWRKTKYAGYMNSFIDSCACSPKDKGYKIYQIFDSDNRIINPWDLCEETFEYYKGHYKGIYIPSWETDLLSKGSKRKKRLEQSYTFRYDPVPRIRKRRGGPRQKNPRTRQIFMIHNDPEYKEYVKGSTAEVPCYWDDKYRFRDIKNWKEQSKCRHQWQRGKL